LFIKPQDILSVNQLFSLPRLLYEQDMALGFSFIYVSLLIVQESKELQDVTEERICFVIKFNIILLRERAH